MITSEKLEEFLRLSQALKNQKKEISDQARKTIREILKSVPENELLSDDCLGYLQYENMSLEYVQSSIHGLKLIKDTIYVTCECDYTQDDVPIVNDWLNPFRDLTFNEFDKYAVIDWVTTLNQVIEYLKTDNR